MWKFQRKNNNENKIIPRKNIFEIFSEYHDKIADAERAGDYNQMDKLIDEAYKLPGLTEAYIWVLDYMKAYVNLIYGGDDIGEKGYEQMLALRNKTMKKYKEHWLFTEDYTLYPQFMDIFQQDYYVMVLQSLLWKGMGKIEKIEEYEDIALEYNKILDSGYKIPSELIKADDANDLYSYGDIALARYYMIKGNVVLSEKYISAALEKKNLEGRLSGFTFCEMNILLENLIFQNQILAAAQLGDFLLERLENNRVKNLYQPDVQRFVSNYYSLLEMMGQAEKGIELIEDCVNQKIIYHVENDNMIMVYFPYLYYHVEKNKKISQKLISYMFRTAEEIESENLSFRPDWYQCNFYQFKYYLNKVQAHSDAKTYLDKSMDILMECDIKEADRQVHFYGFVRICREYYILKDYDRLKKCSGYFLRRLTEFFSAVQYMADNNKMETHLYKVSQIFLYAYSAGFFLMSDRERFEYCINYKNNLSSVIRLRNKGAALAGKAENLLDRVNQYKSKESMPDEKNVYQYYYKELLNEDRELEQLEYEFADAYGKSREFPYYTVEQLESIMPENTAVINFFYVDTMYFMTDGRLSHELNDSTYLEVFALVKKEKTKFIYKRIDDVIYLSEEIKRFNETLVKTRGKFKKIADCIVNTIFSAITGEISGIDNMIICPHQKLCAVPFEVLFETFKHGFEKINLIYCQSIRDLFETVASGGNIAKGACLIGAPQFKIDEKPSGEKNNKNENKKRLADNDSFVRSITPLPFSEYEVKKIAELLGGDFFVREKATKYCIQPGYRYIHIATHGFVKNESKHPWYESSLAFSGAENYLEEGVEKESCGTGLLTAEEISQMNLKSTRLVVLSACDSGKTSLSFMEQQAGLHIAFGTSGVQYIVSSLWEVDDFAAAIFMNYFYSGLKGGLTVPDALKDSRRKIKIMTVADIRKIREMDRELLSSLQMPDLGVFDSMPDEYRPYSHPKYWGNFICYQYQYNLTEK